MVQIDDVVVSLDVFREKFLCNLDVCKGECCIEGDAGAPVELDEVEKLEEVLPVIWNDLSPEARAVIDKQGVVYTDQDGDLVTSIVNGKDCVFTCYDDKGYCYCAIEKAYREGRCSFYKPVSCHLYPIRVGNFGPFKAVNYHKWDVCKAAVILGKKENLPVYKFLKEPLIRKFGQYTDWCGAIVLFMPKVMRRPDLRIKRYVSHTLFFNSLHRGNMKGKYTNYGVYNRSGYFYRRRSFRNNRNGTGFSK